MIRARNALICLDRGPFSLAVDPDEPVAEIRWNGRSSVLVTRLGRHEIWMLDALGHSAIPLRVGEPKELPMSELGPWTLRFGPAEQVHRLLRFKWAQGVGR